MVTLKTKQGRLAFETIKAKVLQIINGVYPEGQEPLTDMDSETIKTFISNAFSQYDPPETIKAFAQVAIDELLVEGKIQSGE